MSAGHGGSSRRLLFLLPFPPRLDATHGGARVAGQIVRALAGRHQVAALYLRRADEAPVDDHVAHGCSLVEEVALPDVPALRTRFARRVAPLRGIPAWAAHVALPAFGERARAVAASFRPDVVHFEYHVMGQYADAVGRLARARVLTEYEAGVLAVREHLQLGRGGGSLAARLQRRAWPRFERRVIAAMDAVVVFAERDRLALQPLAGRTPIFRVGIATPLPAAPLSALGSGPGLSLLFVGSFTHPPNVDAALRLARQIFPRVRAQVPSATLHVVGADPPPELIAAAGHGVQVTGRVSDVTPWLDAAALVVAPLRLGGGMRVKVVEALAHGKALVASPRATEHLGLEDGVHVALAESDDELVATIIALLEAPERRRTLAVNARAWACTHLSEERWVAEYEALYDRVLGEPRVEALR